jgi:hypothetical protein|tara:strand:- start:5059 stop:7149 length:2091 start_codon:yes stop_codon:yes gene_type:complete
MKNNSVSANYENIQKRKKEIAGQLETLLPKDFHFPNKNIQETNNSNERLKEIQERKSAIQTEGKHDHEVYHNSLSESLSEVERFVSEKGYEVNQDELFQFGIGGVSYGQTKKYAFELTRQGEPAKNMINVQIYRMDSGKYELNMYLNNSNSIKEDISSEEKAKFGEKTLNKLLEGYLVAALWAEGGDGEFDGMSIHIDIAQESIDKSKEDIKTFLDKVGNQVYEVIWGDFLTGDNAEDAEQIGHDLLLTRNGHGAGFWDRDLGELGDALTQASEEMGKVHVYKGDDGKVYIEGGVQENRVLSLNEAFESEKIKEKFSNWGMKVNEINDGSVSFTDRNGANMSIPRKDANDIIEPAIMVRTANVNENSAFGESDMMDRYKDQMDLQHGMSAAQTDMGQTDTKIGRNSAFRDAGDAITQGGLGDEDAMQTAYSDLERQLDDLEEVSDDFLDTMSAKNMASDDIGDDFIDPNERGDIESFRAGVETADANSPEMDIAKRNHLARLGKMKMDKLSELNELRGFQEDTTLRDLDSKYQGHPRIDQVKNDLTSRGFGAYPSLKFDGRDDMESFIRVNNPSSNNYKNDGDYFIFELSFEGGMKNTGSKKSWNTDVEVTVSVSKSYDNISTRFEVSNAPLLRPADRESANEIAKNLKLYLIQGLKKFGADISSGRSGGHSEENRETLSTVMNKVKNLNSNDLMK